MADLGCGERGGDIGVRNELGGGAVGGFVPGVGGMTGTRRGLVPEFVEGGGDIIGHGDIDVFVGASVVPVDRETQVFGACAIDCDCIQAFECSEEVVEVVGVGVLHAEIIDDEGKRDRVCFVFPEGGCVFDGGVAVGCKVLDEAVVSDASRLF